MGVDLHPITKDNVTDVCCLQVTTGQEAFVPTNAWSLAQALPELAIAWPRAIVADGTVVGFIMLELDPAHARGWPFWLWHLMIGADHQGRGYGRQALALAVEEVRRRGADALRTSWRCGEGGPEGFYRKLGFVPTGEVDDDGGIVGRLDLPRREPGPLDPGDGSDAGERSPGALVSLAWRSPFANDEVNRLHAEAFGTRLYDESEWDWRKLTAAHSLGWVTARRGEELVGFVNVVWDGLVHAWVQDTMVAAAIRGAGIGTRLVAGAADGAQAAGCDFLHVDFDDDLASFYLDACGFRPTSAGLLELQP